MTPLKEFVLHINLKKTANTIQVQAGIARAVISISKNIYTISPESTILNYIDTDNLQISNLRNHHIQKKILISEPNIPETLTVVQKIKCLSLNDALNLITGTEFSIPLDQSNLPPNTNYQYTIPVSKISISQSCAEIPKIKEVRKHRRKISKLIITTIPDTEYESAWNVNCILSDESRSKSNEIRLFVKIFPHSENKYLISKGSHILDQNFGLSEQMIETRKKLLSTGQIKHLSTGNYRVVKPLRLSSQDALFQLFTGYPTENVANVFRNEPFTWTYEIESSDNDALVTNYNEIDEDEKTIPESVSFIKIPDESMILISCNDAVSTVRFKRGVYSLLPESEILAQTNRGSPPLQKYRDELKNANDISKHPEKPRFMIVEKKIRFQSFATVLEMVTGVTWELPFQRYEDIPDEFTCSVRVDNED